MARSGLGAFGYTALIVKAPADSSGNAVDPNSDTGAMVELHERIESLDRFALSRATKATRWYQVSFGDNGREILHAAVDQLLGYNRFVTRLLLDDVWYLASGADTSSQTADAEYGYTAYGLLAAAQASGIFDEPVSNARMRSRPDSQCIDDPRPLASWVAGLIIESGGIESLSSKEADDDSYESPGVVGFGSTGG